MILIFFILLIILLFFISPFIRNVLKVKKGMKTEDTIIGNIVKKIYKLRK